MQVTAKGVPYIEGGDAASAIDLWALNLATWLDAHPGVTPMTTAVRDALAAGEKWDGRVIANTTTDVIERYDLGTAQWLPVQQPGTFGLYAALPAAAAKNAGFFYFATDARAWFYSDGAAWTQLGETTRMTTAQRDALVAGGKWDGRLIYNLTTLQLEQYAAATASWVAAGGGGATFYSRFLGGN